MTKILRKVLVFFLLFSFAFSALTFPKLNGRVVDSAGILSNQTKTKLISMLSAFEKKTSNQIVVVTLKSLQGHSISDYGYQLGRYWGIGQKNKNNGVLLIIAPKEKKVRIEVGYGLEGTLTDAISSVIIREKILPYFKKSDFNNGTLKGIEAIISTIKGTFKPLKIKKKKDNYMPLLFFIFIFLLAISQNIFPTKYRKYVLKLIPSSFIGFFGFVLAGSIVVGLIVLIASFVFFVFSKAFEGVFANNSTYLTPNDMGGSTFFGTGGGGFDDGGFSSFSGGGGSFGGGGADGGW